MGSDEQAFELVKLRRQLTATLKLVETQLSRYSYLCRACFFSKGLVSRCECNHKMTVGVSA